jgi:hypothetical protein
MGYDLIGCQGRRLSLNPHAWQLCLDAARMYGWEPQGTRASTWGTCNADGTFTPHWTEEMARDWAERCREDKYSSYFSNSFQEIIEPDARALAAALDRAVAALEGDGGAAILMRIRAAGASATRKFGDLLSALGNHLAEETGEPASELRFQSQHLDVRESRKAMESLADFARLNDDFILM